MTERVFAMFDAEMVNLKIVRLVDLPDDKVRFEASDTEASSHPDIVIKMSRESSPTLKKFKTVDGMEIYMWRTSLCIEHKRSGTWIHILDSNHPELIPGDYPHKETFGSNLLKGERNLNCRVLHENMLECIQYLELENSLQISREAVRPLLTESKSSIPRFLGEIIKRDAVAMKYMCAITMDEFTKDTKTLVTPCFHIFEKDAILMWLQSNSLCPICKAPVSPTACLLIA